MWRRGRGEVWQIPTPPLPNNPDQILHQVILPPLLNIEIQSDTTITGSTITIATIPKHFTTFTNQTLIHTCIPYKN